MKRLILLASLVLFSFFSLIDNQKEQPYLANTDRKLSLSCPDYLPPKLNINETTDINKSDAASGNISNDWYSQAINNIRQEEYNITYCEETGALQSPNRANNILFTYHNYGFTAKTMETKIPLFDMNDRSLTEICKKYKEAEEWCVELKIKNYELGFQNSELSFAGNNAWIENDKIRIDFTNTSIGMRQDFVIKEKPLRDLSLQIDVKSKLKLSVNKNSVTFSSKDGTEQMQYSSLKAWDADGKELCAYFEKKNSDRFMIKVDDRDAVYPVTIDPLSSTPDWVKSGDFGYGDEFGYSVADAGDINQDGYSDVIIGSPSYYGYHTAAGRASVFYGSPAGLSTNVGWTFDGPDANAKFGFSVCGAGDVNGDNYDDVIIGAPYFTNGQTNEGKVYVFYGANTGLNNSPAWVYETNKDFAKAGFSVSKAGDFNHDGYDDVIIGSPGYGNDFFNAQGSVFIFHGSSAGLALAPDNTFKNMLDGYTGFGSSVSFAGDINKDGYSDVIIGEPYWPPPPSMRTAGTLESQGKVSVVYGASSDILSGWSATGEVSHSLFGYSVSAAGDINNDGYSDIIIGSPNYHSEYCETSGKIYVYKGSASGLTSSPDWTMDCSNMGYTTRTDGFGRSVSGTDINNDGFSDIITGAHFTDWDNMIDTTISAAYVYYGTATGPSWYCGWYYPITGTTYIAVSALTDVNGDGYGDVILGLKFNYIFPTSHAEVFYGGNTITFINPDWTANGENEYGQFGFSVSTAGDINNDNYDDILIGAPGDPNNGWGTGKVYLYLGSLNGPSAIADWSATGEGGFGYAVSSAGDVNNDSFDDILISSPDFSIGDLTGKVYLYLGSVSGLSSIPAWTCNSLGSGGNFGYSLSCAGDVNGDGYSDIVIGTNGNQNFNSHNVGAYVFCGSASGITGSIPSWTASTPFNVTLIGFGVKVSNAGDVNGDNFDDIIVGASNWSEDSYGKALVYFGNLNRGMFDPADWSDEKTGSPTMFGHFVSDAGDIDKDGFDDILISDVFDDEFNGTVYLYKGSPNGPSNSFDWYATGNGQSLFGYSLTSTGDYNGDGYSDISIGELHGFNPGIHLFFGSANGLSQTEDVSFAPGAVSLSGVADYNGDGFDDILGGFTYFESKAGVFYGKANSFHIYPKRSIVLISENFCVNAVITSPSGKPMSGLKVNFKIKGVNHDSATIFTNSSGIAQYCYEGPNYGIDTIIGKSEKLTDTSIIIRDFPTPVELASFTSSVSGRDVILSWTTSSEINNSGFEVEKSSVKFQMSNEWSKVGFVQGIGNSEAVNNYEFTEKGLNTGKYKYRLKQIDFNGNFKYYELTGEVNIGIPDKYELSQNYPNPFNPVTNLEFGISKLGFVSLKIYDVIGRELVTLVNEIKEPGYYKIKFNGSNLASGVYFYRMTAGEFIAVKKFVVLK